MPSRPGRRRVRSRVGQRIRPVEEIGVSRPAGSTRCPLCTTGVPLLRFVGPDYQEPGLVPAGAIWVPFAPAVDARVRYPRKPDGGRGFYWDSLTPDELATWFPTADEDLRHEVTARMILWLKQFGLSKGKPIRLPPIAWMRGEEAELPELSGRLDEMPTGLRADARAGLLQNPAAAPVRRRATAPSCVPPALTWPATWAPRCEPNRLKNREWRLFQDRYRSDAVKVEGGDQEGCNDQEA